MPSLSSDIVMLRTSILLNAKWVSARLSSASWVELEEASSRLPVVRSQMQCVGPPDRRSSGVRVRDEAARAIACGRAAQHL